MPIGPNGERRPADPIALMVGKIAVGLAEDEYVDDAKQAGGRKGGAARAKKLSAERRREISRMGRRRRTGLSPRDLDRPVSNVLPQGRQNEGSC